MITMDDIAYSSPYRDWSPLGKFFLALSLLVSSILASTIVIPFIVFLFGLVLLFHSTRLHFPRMIAFAILEGLLIFLVGGFVIALVTSGHVVFSLNVGVFVLHFTQEGLELGSLVIMRALAGLTVMLFFASSTPIPQFANALRQLKMPKELVELTVLIYRYSFLLLEQVETMYMAADCRLGFRGYKNKFKTTAKLAVGVFTRSLDMAERSQVALNNRSFRGEFHSFRHPANLSVKWVTASITVFALLYSMNLLIVDPATLMNLFPL